MYTESQYKAWLLDLAQFFVKKHNYQVITMSKEKNELWLINPSDSESPIIMITSQTFEDLNQDLVYKNRESLALVFNVKAQGLNISVQKSEREDDYYMSLLPEYHSPSKFIEYFKGIDSVVEVSKNPEKSLSKSLFSFKRTLQKAHKKARRRLSPTATVFSAIAVIVFMISIFLQSQGYRLEAVALMLGAYYKPLIVNGHQYWRFLTSGFLHVDFFHLFMNMMALKNLATVMEPVLKPFRFTVVMVAGILFGNAFVFITDQGHIGLGMSGALFALMGSLMVYLYESGAFKNKRMLSQMLNVLLINLLISLIPGVSAMAHLGGLQIGVLLGFLFSKREDWDSLRKYVAFLIVVVSLVTVFVMSQNMFIAFGLS